MFLNCIKILKIQYLCKILFCIFDGKYVMEENSANTYIFI